MSKAVQFSTYGAPDVLQLVEVPEPTAGPGQVRIAVRAASVNPYDTKVRSGAFAKDQTLAAPKGLGNDVAGVVDQVGEGVTELAVGEEVLGTGASTYAEYALAKPASLAIKPAEVPWDVAGGIGVAGRTAYRVLKQLDVQEGETLLIHGAAGGVGLFADQLAREWGVNVIGTASEANHDYLRTLGVQPVTYGDGLAERVRAIVPDGVDAVFDTAGRGVLALSVELAGGPDRVITISGNDAAEAGVRFSGGDGDTDTSGAFPEIVALIAAGRLEVPIAGRYPLAEAAAAHAQSEGGHARGKIVLLP